MIAGIIVELCVTFSIILYSYCEWSSNFNEYKITLNFYFVA